MPTTLDLQSNGLGDAGGAALGEALKTNTTLTTLDLQSNGFGDAGGAALGEALKTNTTLTKLDLRNNAVSFIALKTINRRLAANKRHATYVAHLLGATQPPSRVKVHLCGEGGAGKTSLSSALRRSTFGALFKWSKATRHDRPDEPSERTRGIEVKYDTFLGCGFSFWDYGGQPEFHLGHHDYMRGAVADASPAVASSTRSTKAQLRGAAVFLIVVNLADAGGLGKCAEHLRYWRRFIRACLPAEARPLVRSWAHAPTGSPTPNRPSKGSCRGPIMARGAAVARVVATCRPWWRRLQSTAARTPRAGRCVSGSSPSTRY